MATPSLADYWRGHSPTTDEPGGFRILRTQTVSSVSWTEVDIRAAAYAGAADGLAQNAGSAARGLLRMVTVLNMSAAAVEDVNFALVSGPPVPATAYNIAAVDGPALEIRVSVVGLDVHKFWIKADTGTPTVQMEIWYDVPPAS